MNLKYVLEVLEYLYSKDVYLCVKNKSGKFRQINLSELVELIHQPEPPKDPDPCVCAMS